MPQKSKQERVKRAKAEGVMKPGKDVDLGMTTAASNHAAKKSRHLAGKIAPADRTVSPKRAPGQGRKTAPMREATSPYRRSEPGAGTRPAKKGRRKETRARR